jgi:hypothetical protein
MCPVLSQARPPRTVLLAIAAVAGLLAVQWLLFAAYVRREVAWTYPPHFDQTTYLYLAYDTWVAVEEQGWVAGLGHGWRRSPPNGAALQLEAALVFGAVGPSRLAALSVNWLHFAALQAALVGALWWSSRRWELPALAGGLLLSAGTPFFWVGGLADFRPDFIAFCLYGMFLAAVWWSDVFRRPGACLVAGVVGALCVVSRPLTTAYLGSLLAFSLAALGVQAARASDPERRAGLRRQLKGAFICATLSCAFVLPALVAGARQLWHHYYQIPVASQERVVWSGSAVLNVRERALYYPASVTFDHSGALFLLLGLGALGLLALALVLPGPWRDEGAPRASVPRGAVWFMTAALLLPLLTLTLYPSRNPTVGSVLVGPLVFLIAAGAGHLARRVSPRVMQVLAIAVLATGLAKQALRLEGPARSVMPVEALREVVRLEDTLVTWSEARGWEKPVLLADRVRDYLPGIRVSTYERHRRLLGLQRSFNMIMGPPVEDIMAALRGSDFVILTRPQAAPPFAYDAAFVELHPRLLAYCKRNLVRVGRFHVPEEIVLFARPGPAGSEAQTSTVTP